MRCFKLSLVLLSVAMLVAALVLSRACVAAPPELLTVAHRVMPTADWAEADSYGWLSDRSVLFFRAAGKLPKPVRLDTATGRQTPLLFMDAGWADFAKNCHGETGVLDQVLTYGFSAILSPDGRRLYWQVTYHPPGFESSRTLAYVSDVDGTHGFQFHGEYQPSAPLWLGDCHELVYFLTDTQALPTAHVVRLDKPSLDFKADAMTVGLTGTFSKEDLLSGGRAVVAPDHRILTDDWLGGGPFPKTIHVMQATFTPPPGQGVTTGTATVALPPDYTVMWMTYSPQGDRIAWTLRQSNGAASLWVCGVDGTGWREVGALPSKVNPTDVRWLPSGKAISFLCDGALWTVTVAGR